MSDPIVPGSNTGEIRSLTALRAIAALFVFVHHYTPFPSIIQDGILFSIIRQGHIGVTIFFALSGFLITLRYFDSMGGGSKRTVSLFDYFWKRIARIYPLYLFLLFINLVWPFRPATIQSAIRPEALLAIFLLQGYFNEGRLIVRIIPTAWTLTVEEAFYALAPLIFFSLRKIGKSDNDSLVLNPKRLLIALIGWVGLLLLLGLALTQLANLTGLTANMSGLLSKNMFVYTIFGRFFDFAVGIGAALLYRSGRVTRRVERGPRRWALEFLPILCLGLIMLFEHGMHISGGYAVLQGWLFNYAIAMVTGVLILALTHEEILVSRLLAHRVPVYLGRISYALYLVQLMQPIGAILTRSMNDQGLLYSPTAYVVVSGISAFLYEFVEEPARRWLVRRGDKMKSGFTWLNLIGRDFGVRTKKQLPTMPDAE